MQEKPPQQSLFGPPHPPAELRRSDPPKQDALSRAEAIRVVEAVRPNETIRPREKQAAYYGKALDVQHIEKQKKLPFLASHALTVVHYGATFALASFNVMFSASFAGQSIVKQIIFGAVAIIFAFGEVGLWERGGWAKGRDKWLYKSCALGLALFSFIGGAASSLSEVSQYEGAIVDTASIDEEIESLFPAPSPQVAYRPQRKVFLYACREDVRIYRDIKPV